MSHSFLLDYWNSVHDIFLFSFTTKEDGRYLLRVYIWLTFGCRFFVVWNDLLDTLYFSKLYLPYIWDILYMNFIETSCKIFFLNYHKII